MSLYRCNVNVDRDDVIFEKNFKMKYLSIESCAEHPNENFEVLPNLAVSCQNLEKLSVDRCGKERSFNISHYRLHLRVEFLIGHSTQSLTLVAFPLFFRTPTYHSITAP